MVVTLCQQYNAGEGPTVILYTYINRHTRPRNTTKTKGKTLLYINKKVVTIYDNNAIEPYNSRGLGKAKKCRGETHRYTVHSN